MFEAEMKFRLQDPVLFEEKAKEILHIEFGVPHIEEDLYFQRLSRDFRETGEALRIRTIGADLMVTYKGPRREGAAKIREEIELPLTFKDETASVEERKKDWIRLISKLGCEPFAEVRKLRKTAHCSIDGLAFTVTRDSIGELGEYTEIETLVDSEEGLEYARNRLTALAALLGLNELVYSSYLSLLLKKRGKFPILS